MSTIPVPSAKIHNAQRVTAAETRRGRFRVKKIQGRKRQLASYTMPRIFTVPEDEERNKHKRNTHIPA
jgi:hypothetical protein